jgi:SAM-dependent methyltransferase
MGFHLHDLLSSFVRDDDSRQLSVQALLELAGQHARPKVILDFGCGDAADEHELLQRFQDASYVGVDVPSSPEVQASAQPRPANFVVYDGARLPFKSASIDLVYSRQVLEHVPHPQRALREIHRVLRADGLFVGSTSHLEAFHSFSYWNFTPYGLVQLGQESGLRALLVAPGIDSLALLLRRFRRSGARHRWLVRESPANRLISVASRFRRWDHRYTNCVKLQFCGHFFFIFRKAPAAGTFQQALP